MDTMLTVLQLRVLHEMLRLGSVGAVAEALEITQPSVSLHLRNLRRRLDDPLFVRAGNGLVPTERALTLRAPTQAAIEAVAAVSRPAAPIDPASLRRAFRIAMTDASQVTLLPQLLAYLHSHAPHATLEVELLGRATHEGLREGRIDLALGYIPGLGSGIVHQRLFYQDWVCLASSPPPADPDAYACARHVEVASGTGAGLLHKALANRHMARNVALSLPGFLGLAAVLAQSDLVATVPRHTATVLARQNGLVVGVCPIPVDGFAVCHYWHERVGHDPAHRWLRSAVRACLAFDGVVDGTTQIADPDTEILPRADTFKHDGPGSYSAV